MSQGLPGSLIEDTRQAAIEVLLFNAHGPYQGLPRTAGWGYPEPYTRDWMIATPGILVTGNAELIDAVRRILIALAGNQTSLGHIPSLAHDPNECGASDTTPLFLIGLALYRSVSGETRFLEQAGQRALAWMRCQAPDERSLLAQQPTSDWRDEQWVPGYALYTNALWYACLRLYGLETHAGTMHGIINQPADRPGCSAGLGLADAPYYALWAYKVHSSNRFDLLGNSLAILFGLADSSRASAIISWYEAACERMKKTGELSADADLAPCLIPYILPQDAHWMPRYQRYNQPGEYHNGGAWPFITGFYIAALVAAGEQRLAAQKLAALCELMKKSRTPGLKFGFNEWFRAQDARPLGEDWQTWSAAMFLYAAQCVEDQHAPFFADWFG